MIALKKIMTLLLSVLSLQPPGTRVFNADSPADGTDSHHKTTSNREILLGESYTLLHKSTSRDRQYVLGELDCIQHDARAGAFYTKEGLSVPSLRLFYAEKRCPWFKHPCRL